MRKNRIFNKKGEGYVDTAILVLIVASLLVIVINLFNVIRVRQDLDMFASEILECATTYGRVGSEVTERMNKLKNETGLSPSVSYEGTSFFSGSSEKVQLGDTIYVTVSYDMNVKGFGVFVQPVTVKAKKSGLSQVYWK